MKFQAILSITALCAIALFTACKNDSAAAKDATVETGVTLQPAAGESNITTAPSVNPAAPVVDPAAPVSKEPPQNAAGVWHYTCQKGCAGGAGSAIACAKCGTTLTHNTAYHGQASPPAVGNSPTGTPPGTPAGTTVQTPPKSEPAQNAAGVWHYTCPDGCAGGGGAAGPCAKCSKTLVHNNAYHGK